MLNLKEAIRLESRLLLFSLTILTILFDGCFRGEGADIKIKHPGYLESEIFKAISDDDADRLWHLIQEGGDINAKDNLTGTTPLMMAVNGRKRELVRLLCDTSTVRLDERNESGQTALMLAAVIGGPAEILTVLLEHSADPNIRDDEGAVALVEILRFSDIETVEVLIEHGAKINAADGKGRNPLFAAATACNLKAVNLLLAAGANPSSSIAGEVNTITAFSSFLRDKEADRAWAMQASDEDARRRFLGPDSDSDAVREDIRGLPSSHFRNLLKRGFVCDDTSLITAALSEGIVQ